MALSIYDRDLRQVAGNRHALRHARVTALARRDALSSGDRAGRARLESYAGEASRILGEHGAAIAHQWGALGLIDGHGRGRVFWTYRLRLAEAYRCGGEPAVAEPIVAGAVDATAEVEDLAPLRLFALQHHGKCLIDLGQWDAAADALGVALALREAAGATALADSTRAAIELLARRRDHD